jgi:hypothetical protein
MYIEKINQIRHSYKCKSVVNSLKIWRHVIDMKKNVMN